jgi:Bacterial Ig-like domain (group 3)/FG-GAP-like repeat
MSGLRFVRRLLRRNSVSKGKAPRKPARPRLGLEALEDRTLPSSFNAPVAFDLPAAPKAVATGHFEGPGAPLDVVTANGNGTVSVLLGKGDGTLLNPINLSVGGSLTAVAVGDLRGNGLQDVVAANGNGTVSVLLSNGNGTFQSPETIAVGATPEGVAVGDFRGNGRLDIATANGNGTVSVLPGNGDGTFQGPITSPVGGSLTSVAVGEFNGDGKPDLVVGTGSGLDVLLGNGDGTFQLKSTVPFLVDPSVPDVTESVTSVAVGDFRGNGKQDIVANASGNLDVLLGNGDGTFGGPVALSVGPVSIDSVVVGDFTGDGKLDLVTSNAAPPSSGGPTLSVLAGNGDGTFRAARTVTAGEAGNALAAGDFRGDGKLDLAVASDFGANNATVLLGNGDGTFVTTPAVPAGSLPSAVAAGDFTGDGQLDLVTTGFGGNAVVQLNNGDGTFRTGPTLAVAGTPTSVVVGDFTGDGRQDLAVGTQAGTIDVFPGNGDGTFQAPRVVNLGVSNSVRAVVAGDFNGDGRLDLAVTSDQLQAGDTGLVTVLLGNGDGTFRNAGAVNVGVGAEGLVAADLNGDGKLDLVTTSLLPGGARDVKVLPGNGDATFQTPLALTPGGRATSVAAGDFTGDGKPDLVLVDSFNNTVRVLPGGGNGTFGSPIAFTFADAAKGLGGPAVGDFFGDGKLSVAVTSGLGTVSVLRGNGDGTFQAPVNFLVGFHGTQPATVIAGDLNGDGKPDLVATNALSGDVSVLLNTTGAAPVKPAATATALAADAATAVFGQPVTLTATVTSPAGVPAGTVTFFDGTIVLGEVAVDPNGQAAFAVPLGVGVHSLTASFAGTGGFTASRSAALSETVNRAATTTALSVDDSQGPAVVILTAAVSPVAPGAGLPTGTVTFLDGTTVLGTATLDAGGQATLVVESLSPGTNSLTASFGGDGDFQGSTSAAQVLTFNPPAATATALSSSIPSAVFGQAITLTARVTSSAGTPAGLVTFFDGGTPLGSAPLNSAGQATLTVSLGVGSHSLLAAFGAASAFAASNSAPLTETVAPAATTTALGASLTSVVSGRSVTFTATVAAAAPGAGVPTGTVTFLDGTTVLGTVPVGAGGKATLTTSFSTTGRHTIKAVYNGDGNFTASSGSLTEQVRTPVALAPTTTALVASANLIWVGQTVTFTASVSGAAGTGTPTGTVTFFVGNVAVATVKVNASGKASLTGRLSAAGQFTITAVYSGDSNFAASSQSLTEQVN